MKWSKGKRGPEGLSEPSRVPLGRRTSGDKGNTHLAAGRMAQCHLVSGALAFPRKSWGGRPGRTPLVSAGPPDPLLAVDSSSWRNPRAGQGARHNGGNGALFLSVGVTRTRQT